MNIIDSQRRRRTRGVQASALLVGLALAISSCGAPESAPPGQEGSGGGEGETVTIGVGGQTLLTYLPTTLANELGYYEEEGLNVDLQDLQGGSKALTAMIGGSTDVTSGYYEHTIQMQAKNQPVKAFVNMNLSSGLALVVAEKNKDTIKTVADLEGKNVGVTSPGSSTDMFVKYLLSQNGMEIDAAAVSAIGAGSSAVAAVEQGQVDAAVMLEPDITVLGKRLGTEPTIIEDVRTLEGLKEVFDAEAWPSSSLYATADWL
ncbi:ABC transporter substrate-binding protein, partial [Arthrobacter sp. H41]|uniref:ABC transporter substrate-binding protein n=1 Tax=Arthrobacter sp. H41 TaxID=1312978 RepID=UPI00047EBF5B